MNCERAKELAAKHLEFLSTLTGPKLADKEEILRSFRHIKSCPEKGCSSVWYIIFRASRECSLVLAEQIQPQDESSGWNGNY